MEIKEIHSKKLYKEFLVGISSSEIEKEINNKINELVPKTTLPGFRPGKAPVNLVRKKYEKDILGEIVSKSVQDNTKKLIHDKNLRPLRTPKIEIVKFDESHSLEFNIKIDGVSTKGTICNIPFI